MRRLAWLFALLLFLTPPLALAEDPPEEGDEPAEEGTSEEPEGIAWLHDIDEAKAKAQEDGKGLFVYMTPTWFT